MMFLVGRILSLQTDPKRIKVEHKKQPKIEECIQISERELKLKRDAIMLPVEDNEIEPQYFKKAKVKYQCFVGRYGRHFIRRMHARGPYYNESDVQMEIERPEKANRLKRLRWEVGK